MTRTAVARRSVKKGVLCVKDESETHGKLNFALGGDGATYRAHSSIEVLIQISTKVAPASSVSWRAASRDEAYGAIALIIAMPPFLAISGQQSGVYQTSTVSLQRHDTGHKHTSKSSCFLNLMWSRHNKVQQSKERGKRTGSDKADPFHVGVSVLLTESKAWIYAILGNKAAQIYRVSTCSKYDEYTAKPNPHTPPFKDKRPAHWEWPKDRARKIAPHRVPLDR